MRKTRTFSELEEMDIYFEELLNTDDEWSVQGKLCTMKRSVDEEIAYV